MKYLASCLLGVLFMVSCSSEGVPQVNPDETVKAEMVSLTLLGNEKIQVDQKTPISISALYSTLENSKMSKKAKVSVTIQENTSIKEMTEVQNILRKLEVLSIDYKIIHSS